MNRFPLKKESGVEFKIPMTIGDERLRVLLLIFIVSVVLSIILFSECEVKFPEAEALCLKNEYLRIIVDRARCWVR